MPVFTRDEYLERIAKTKKSMQEKGIDVLMVSHPANMNYLTGYDGWSFYVHQCVLVGLDKEEPIWIGRGMDANGCRITSFLKNENIYEYADNFVQSLERHPMQFVADIIKKHGWEKKTVAVEMDQFYFTAQSYVTLQQSLPNAKFTNGNALVNWVRVIKSPAELEMMRRAGQIAVKVMDAAKLNIRAGVRECDAASKIVEAQYAGTSQYGGDYPAIVPLMMAGEATKTPHLTWSDKPFKKDEAVLLELCGAYKHYHAPIARTIFLGENPPKLMKDTAEVVIEGLAKTLEWIKPGVTAEGIEAKWREAISHSKVVKESRLGYSIGVNYPPDWGEHTISLRPGDKTVIKPNMALHLIPGIWYDDVGFEIDASIHITETGYESFYEYPIDIIYNK
ncbi:MAG: M24 family metallopeptidase [Sphaerochaetaceae bacterium]|jgi:Xaa-Pro dipeptidase|nr:M24 family metallopeptidase [Sphaerochaetaceae bacterium]MDD3941318.1 M24 family metallopeptidase [Sphaerochaetaceae bacterium]MDX9939045.1 M24 family metallopeptidase [Sphaerochaetaceae bacterium]